MIPNTKRLAYGIARPFIKDGDLLLYRPHDLKGTVISLAGRSQYSHAAMAGWWNYRLMVLEMVGSGGRAQLLSNQVAAYPGRIDVYRMVGLRGSHNAAVHRGEALTTMIGLTGRRYGHWPMLRTVLLHLPIIRLFARPALDDTANGSLPVCSSAVALSWRAAGYDPVPNLADRQTEPGDLARSPLFRYHSTLFPGKTP